MTVPAAVLAAEEAYEAGPTGLLVIVLLAIGIFLLGRSMIKHVRRVPLSFDPPEGDGRVDPPDARTSAEPTEESGEGTARPG